MPSLIFFIFLGVLVSHFEAQVEKKIFISISLHEPWVEYKEKRWWGRSVTLRVQKFKRFLLQFKASTP